MCSTIFCAGQELLEFEEELHEFQEHYSKVVHNQASVTLKITKCTTIGPPRKGKTCLKHLLTGQEWNVEAGTASTDVMEAPEWVECYSLEEGGAEKPWKLLSAEQQQGELIRAVNTLTTSSTELTTTPSDVQHPTTPSDAPPTTTSSGAQHPTTPSDAPPTATSSDAQHPTTPSDTHFRTTPSSAPPPSTKPDAAEKPATVRQALEALAGACNREALQDFLKDKEGKVLGETRLVHFIDTGGQAIYHDVHPVLITSPSVYLVVFSLKELYEKKSHKEMRNYFRSNLIQRPLRSIYTFGMKTFHKEGYVVLHSEAPKILIVGTHLDQIPLEDSGGTQKDFLDDISKMIEREISNKPYRQFVQFDPKDRPFWAVDNTQAGKEQDEDAKKYSTALRMMVQEGSTEMSVKVPLPWLLLQLVMEGKGKHYCKYSELLEEACKLGYVREHSPSEDLDTMLWLFHILGLFYHKVPSGHRKEDSLVFINPDYLYSATSDFLMAAKEEVEDSSKDQHLNQAATMEETEDSQRGSGEGHHQTQAVTKEETEDSQGGSEEGQYQTMPNHGQFQNQAATKEEMCYEEEVAEKGSRKQQQEPKGIVQKTRVIQRIQRNFDSIQHEMEAVLQKVENAMTQEAAEAVLKLLHDQLKEKIEQRNELFPRERQDVSSVKAKRQLLIVRLIHSVASSVEAVLNASERKGDVDHVRREIKKAVENTRMQYQSRSIDSCDMDKFLSILADLRIVAQLSDSDSYVIPAALPEVPQSKEMTGSFKAASILVTVVSQTIIEVCFLPSGLFCCLISELVTEAGWTVHPHGRTHVAFTHKGLGGKVHVVEHESYIEINMESEASLEELTITCQSVREMIHKHVVKVYKNLYSDPTAGTTFEESLVWGFQCEEHPDDDTHIAAFRKADDDEYWTECLLESWNVRDVEPKQLVWFSSELGFGLD